MPQIIYNEPKKKPGIADSSYLRNAPPKEYWSTEIGTTIPFNLSGGRGRPSYQRKSRKKKLASSVSPVEEKDEEDNDNDNDNHKNEKKEKEQQLNGRLGKEDVRSTDEESMKKIDDANRKSPPIHFRSRKRKKNEKSSARSSNKNVAAPIWKAIMNNDSPFKSDDDVNDDGSNGLGRGNSDLPHRLDFMVPTTSARKKKKRLQQPEKQNHDGSGDDIEKTSKMNVEDQQQLHQLLTTDSQGDLKNEANYLDDTGNGVRIAPSPASKSGCDKLSSGIVKTDQTEDCDDAARAKKENDTKVDCGTTSSVPLSLASTTVQDSGEKRANQKDGGKPDDNVVVAAEKGVEKTKGEVDGTDRQGRVSSKQSQVKEAPRKIAPGNSHESRAVSQTGHGTSRIDQNDTFTIEEQQQKLNEVEEQQPKKEKNRSRRVNKRQQGELVWVRYAKQSYPARLAYPRSYHLDNQNQISTATITNGSGGGIDNASNSSNEPFASLTADGNSVVFKSTTARERLMELQCMKDKLPTNIYNKEKKKLRTLKELESHNSWGNKGLPSHSVGYGQIMPANASDAEPKVEVRSLSSGAYFFVPLANIEFQDQNDADAQQLQEGERRRSRRRSGTPSPSTVPLLNNSNKKRRSS